MEISEEGEVTIKSAGSSVIRATKSATSTYKEVSSENYTLNIAKKELVVSLVAAEIDEGDEYEPEFSYNGFVLGETESVLTALPRIISPTEIPTDVGEHNLMIGGASAANYIMSYQGAKLTISSTSKQAQTISITNDFTGLAYGFSAISLTHVLSTNHGTGEVAYTILEGDSVVSITNNEMSIIGAGNVKLKISIAECAEYQAAYNEVEFAVAKATLTVKLNNASTTYGTAPTFTYDITGFKHSDESALKAALVSAITTDYVATLDVAGSPHTITPTTTHTLDNYNITMQSGTLAVGKAALTVKLNNTATTYGTAPTFTYTITGWKNNEGTSLEAGLLSAITNNYSAETHINVNDTAYTITPSTTHSLANYNIIPQSGELTVNKAVVAIALNEQTITEDDTYTPTFTYVGFKYDEDESELTNPPSVVETVTNAVGKQTLTISGATADNYTFTYTGADLIVTARVKKSQTISITTDLSNLSYGDGAVSLAISQSASKGTGAISYSIVTGTSASVDASTGELTILSAGTAKVRVNIAADDYYNAAQHEVEFTVAKAMLTVKLDDKSTTYGTAPTFTYTITGWKHSDESSLKAALVSAIATDYVATLDVAGSPHPITPTTTHTLDNYNITLQAGELTITTAELNIKLIDVIVYEGYSVSEVVFTYTITGWKNNEDLSLATNLENSIETNFDYSNMKTSDHYDITPSSTHSLPNYHLTFTKGVLFVAKQTVISTSPTASSIVYGDKLSESVLSGGVANIAGTWTWETPNEILAVGTHNAVAVFTPTDPDYEEKKVLVSVTVTKLTLSTPILSTEVNVIKWSAVDYAEGYILTILKGGVAFATVDDLTVSDLSYTFTSATASETATYTFTLVATSSDTANVNNSSASTSVVLTYTKLSAPTLGNTDNLITWGSVTGDNVEYVVTINDDSVTTISLQYEVTATSAGDVVVYVKAISDSVFFFDSEENSKTITFTKADTPTLIFDAVNNIVKIDGTAPIGTTVMYSLGGSEYSSTCQAITESTTVYVYIKGAGLLLDSAVATIEIIIALAPTDIKLDGVFSNVITFVLPDYESLDNITVTIDSSVVYGTLAFGSTTDIVSFTPTTAPTAGTHNVTISATLKSGLHGKAFADTTVSLTFNGDGTQANPFLVTSAAEFESARINEDGKYYVQQNDIEGISSATVNSVFVGNYNGGGYKLVLSGTTLALFYEIGETAVVKNVQVSGAVDRSGSATSSSFLAPLAILSNINRGEVDGIVAYHDAEISSYASNKNGRVGASSDPKLLFYTDSNRFSGVGIIAGINYGMIKNSSNAIGISGAIGLGGITSINLGTITNCVNTATIKFTSSSITSGNGSAYIGGIVGYNAGTITKCVNSGAVTAIKGGGSNYNNYIGGIAGVNGENPLGISMVGITAEISYSENTGAVTGDYRVGGIAGSTSNSGVVSHSINSGAIDGRYDTAGITGGSTAVVSYCFNYVNIAGGGDNWAISSNASYSFYTGTGKEPTGTGNLKLDGNVNLFFDVASVLSDFVLVDTATFSFALKHSYIGTYHVVEFKDNNDGTIALFNVADGVDMPTSVAPNKDKEHHTYKWQIDDGGEWTGGLVTSGLTIVLVYTANTYKVTFDVAGIEDQNIVYDGANLATAPSPAPEKVGFTFKGWTEDLTGEIAYFDFATVIDRDIALYAHFEPITYTLSFGDNGGTGGNMEQIVFTYDGATVSIPQYVGTNGTKVFLGWAWSGSASAPDILASVRNVAIATLTAQTEGGTKNAITLYAVWEELSSLSVTFYYGDENGESTAITFDSGGEKTIPSGETIAIDGYRFIGWYDELLATCIVESTVTQAILADAYVWGESALYAKYELIDYSVKYYVATFDENGVIVDTFVVDEDISTTYVITNISLDITDIEPSSLPTYYTFVGWYNDETGGTEVEHITHSLFSSAETIQLYARYELKGTGTEESPYLIVSTNFAEQMAKDGVGVYFLQLEDINLNAIGYTDPLVTVHSTLQGTYNGGGKTIKREGVRSGSSALGTIIGEIATTGAVINATFDVNFARSGSTEAVYGFGGVAKTNKGLIKDVTLTGTVSHNAYSDMGGVVGYNEGRIENVTVTAFIGFYGQAATKPVNGGGIAGVNSGLILNSIFNSTSAVGLSSNSNSPADGCGSKYFGGIAGNNTGIIYNCENRTSIGLSAGVKWIGGIAGISSGTIEYSINYGFLDGSSNEKIVFAAGIVGSNSGVVQYCGNEGEVNTKRNSGSSGTGNNHNAGIAGENVANAQISYSYNIAKITGDYRTGGIVGDNNGSISYCYNNGIVDSRDHVAGMSYRIAQGISYCFNGASVNINNSDNTKRWVIANGADSTNFYITGLSSNIVKNETVESSLNQDLVNGLNAVTANAYVLDGGVLKLTWQTLAIPEYTEA